MQFWLFRISLNANQSNSLFAQQLDGDAREIALRKAFESPMHAVYWKSLYSLYNIEFDQDVVTGRISHPDTIDRTIESIEPGILVDTSEDSHSWCHFVYFGRGEQIMAVQRKQPFFSGGADGLAKIIQHILTASIQDPRIDVKVRPISRIVEFWRAVENADRLYGVRFEFIAPNMFGGRKPLADLLKLERVMHNALVVEAAVKNPEGLLKFERTPDNEAEVDYASAGGGSWAVEYADKLGKRELKSDDTAAGTIEIEDDDQSKVSIKSRTKEIIEKVLWFINNTREE